MAGRAGVAPRLSTTTHKGCNVSTNTSRLMMAAGARAPVIVKYSTAGSYTWVAPAGVTLVKRLTGRGGTGTQTLVWQNIGSSESYLVGGIYSGYNPGVTLTTVGASTTYEAIKTFSDTLIPQWSAITTNTSGASYSGIISWYYTFLSGNWKRWPGTSYSGFFRRTGTVSSTGSLNSTTGTVSTTSPLNRSNSATLIQKRVIQNNNGGNSTALGNTFFGTSDTNPATTTYNNISVTPGASYAIVVGTSLQLSTGFIELEY